MSEQKVVKKRGRKSKKEKELELKNAGKTDVDLNKKEKPLKKKRGRKPKGGIIVPITKEKTSLSINTNNPNVILHLKCKSSDIKPNNNFFSELSYNPDVHQVSAFDNNEHNFTQLEKQASLSPKTTQKMQIERKQDIDFKVDKDFHSMLKKEETIDTAVKTHNVSMKLVHQKIKDLEHKLHNNSISDKKSSCFWCTCKFDNPQIYIPKQQVKEEFEVYGCFCSPECACAHLFNEHLDSSTKWERYSLLNTIYSPIYNYENSIKPAPDPHYLLDKFYGNLSIDEYRALLSKHTMLMIIDKPLTRIYPELHQNNNELNISNNYFKQSKKESSNYSLSRKNKIKKNDIKSFF